MLPRLSIFLLFVLAQQVSGNSTVRELKDWFIENESHFNEIADEFKSALSTYPSLNHIDLEKHSPKPLALRGGVLERIRNLLKGLRVSSVMRGDFSVKNLSDTVYLLQEERIVGGGDFGLQIGFVRTDGDIEPIVESFGSNSGDEYIEFIQISKNWYLYQRRFCSELISYGPFAFD